MADRTEHVIAKRVVVGTWAPRSKTVTEFRNNFQGIFHNDPSCSRLEVLVIRRHVEGQEDKKSLQKSQCLS